MTASAYVRTYRWLRGRIRLRTRVRHPARLTRGRPLNCSRLRFRGRFDDRKTPDPSPAYAVRGAAGGCNICGPHAGQGPIRTGLRAAESIAIRYSRMANIPADEEPSGRAHRAVGFRLPLHRPHHRVSAGEADTARIWCLRAGLVTGCAGPKPLSRPSTCWIRRRAAIPSRGALPSAPPQA